ncbi:MAG: amino acid adenylation domain-containing protein [Acidobacteriota bacterium]
MNAARFEDVYELSPMQQGILFHTLYDPAANIYVEQSLATLKGSLEPERFDRAWQAVAARHAILRTSFHWEGLQKPVQVVHPEARVPVAFHDWRALPAEESRTRLEEFVSEDRARGFDLASPPLLRVTVCQTADDVFECLLTFQHLLLDRWSRFLVLTDVIEAYTGGDASLSRGGPVPPYRDYIAWVQRQDPGQGERFWRRALAGFRTPTTLHMDGDSSPGTERSGEATLKLTEEVSERIRGFARRNRLTLNTVLQGAWAILLSRYSGEEDVLFGATVAGRPPDLPGVESMVGLFINSLPVRAAVPGESELIATLTRLQQLLLDLRQFEHSSLLDIQGWSEVPRGTPLFESLVVFENVGGEVEVKSAAPGPLAVEAVRSIGGGTNYPLTLMAAPGTRFSFKLQGDPAKFEDATLERMIAQLGMLLEEMSAATTTSRVLDLRMMSVEERRRILEDWNRTDAEFPGEATIHGLFEEQARRVADSVAVVAGDERLTYSGLNTRANRLASYLSKRRVGAETLVGVFLDRSAEMIVALLGILKAGGAYVPLDPAYPSARLEHTLRDAGVSVVVTQSSLDALLPEGPFERVRLDAERGEIEREPASDLEGRAAATNLAYVIYTSGSTGLPKGVAIEHHSAVALLSWAREAYVRGELGGVLASTSICFDLSVFEIFAPLAAGGAVILARDALHLSDLRAASEVRLVNTVPSAIAQLVRLNALPPSVSTVNLAGEPLLTSLVQEILGSGGVNRVFDLYGPSEDTTYSTWALRSPDGPATIGRPLPNKRAYILDSRMEPVPIGVSGDLYVAGEGVARGYLHRPELTAERFLPDPFRAGSRMYRTGDRARFLADGRIQFLGRLDNQVKVRGYRIELGEIEETLSRHPGVMASVVVAWEDEGAKRLVAYVRPSGAAVPEASELRDFLKRSLPDYMLPSQVVPVDSFPLTPNGKIDRKALPPPAPKGERSEELRTGTPVERVVATMWQEVLRVDRVGVSDDFFALGGHSLLATSVVSRVRKHFQIEMPLRAIFENPTVASLAAEIDRETAVKASGSPKSVVSIPRSARRLKTSGAEES